MKSEKFASVPSFFPFFCNFALNMKEKKQGLTPIEVEASRARHGENVLTPPRRPSMWKLYLEKYEDPMVRILLVAAVASLVLAFVKGDFVETIGIIAAVILATTVGFYFERDAARKFDVLTQLGEEQPVKVVREGRIMEIPRRDVVVDDVVLVETGDEVPADGRLLEATDLQVDESSLTGEPMTVKMSIENQRSTAEGEVKGEMRNDGADMGAYPINVLLRSSMVLGGSGCFVVTAVGDSTEIGHVARQAAELTGVKTPLNIQLDKLAKVISKVGGLLSVLSFLIFLGHDIITNELWHTDDYLGMLNVTLRYFMMAVTLIVMAVPEGLPMAVTLALALNMRRMLKSNNLVRKLQASETMGAVTVICTDKTGTLTENRMTVSDVRCVMEDERWGMEDLYKAIALNTTATHDVGNPTEQALLRWLQQQGVDYQQLRDETPITAREPFSTERKYMTTTVGDTTYIKGAPEIVIHMCGLKRDMRLQVKQQLYEWQQHAMRTLAIAANNKLMAIVAISDPLREDVPEAISQCRQAGIDVKIVTGDTAATAWEIGIEAGVVKLPEFYKKKDDSEESEEPEMDKTRTMTGAEFASLSDEEALEVIGELKVMSRARPMDKQRLVALLQQRGEVVAVTGDGTNDAPALNRAHVGLSLGSGTSVAKQASDITLIDDSFGSIVQAVMWGRSLYKNIQRFIFFQLIVNVAALLLVLFGAFIGTELPLTITQILWINLIMDTFAAMALASLPPSREVMKQKPRRQDAFIINRGMKRGIAFIGITFFLLLGIGCWLMEVHPIFLAIQYGLAPDEAQTVFFTVFVLLQWWNLFNARMLGSSHSAFHKLWKCKGFLIVLGLVLAGQWLIVTFGGQMFRTVPLSLECWLYMFLLTSPVLLVGELYRGGKRV